MECWNSTKVYFIMLITRKGQCQYCKKAAFWCHNYSVAHTLPIRSTICMNTANIVNYMYAIYSEGLHLTSEGSSP